MKFKLSFFSVLSTILVLVIVVTVTNFTAAENAAPSGEPKPVEDDMHEFMEYVFQPTYQRLKPLMAGAPSDNAGWKGIKADSLILAEGGNLLLARVPEDDAEKWVEFSTAVRASGGELYRAAKAKKFESAREHYEAMITQCNACHTHFAHGEHQLSP